MPEADTRVFVNTGALHLEVAIFRQLPAVP